MKPWIVYWGINQPLNLLYGISDYSALPEETTSVTNEIKETTSSTTSDGEPISQPGTPVVEPVVQKVSHRKRKKASDNFEKME